MQPNNIKADFWMIMPMKNYVIYKKYDDQIEKKILSEYVEKNVFCNNRSYLFYILWYFFAKIISRRTIIRSDIWLMKLIIQNRQLNQNEILFLHETVFHIISLGSSCGVHVDPHCSFFIPTATIFILLGRYFL
jgi:hypothetical protein